MALQIYNTRTRKKEEFKPLLPGKVTLYVCGVTAYDYCHIGHARSAVAFDVIVRHLRKSFEVTFVRNITDIDDKIIQRAIELGVSWDEHAQKYTHLMHEDFQRLHVLPPDVEPKATEHLKEMVGLIESLIKNGLAYESEGDVFFSVFDFSSYGKLSGKLLEDLQAGARVEIDEKKRNPLDFALWKAAKPGEPTWPSPWGEGRPGWHIECSAMSQKYLGNTFDIHGGGRDLIFPHHENEVAQSEGASGEPFARYWMHNGFVTINKEKMSKSLDNFFTIRDVLLKFHPEVVRLFLISSHYRGPIDYAEENLRDAQTRVERIYQFKARAERVKGKVKVSPNLEKIVMQLPELVLAAMDDDFNSAKALGFVFEMVRKVNTFLDQNEEGNEDLCRKALKILEDSSEVLGVFQMTPKEWLHRPVLGGSEEKMEEMGAKEIEGLIEERAQARKEKNWARSDEIRDLLLKKNVILEDTAHGTLWRVKS